MEDLRGELADTRVFVLVRDSSKLGWRVVRWWDNPQGELVVCTRDPVE